MVKKSYKLPGSDTPHAALNPATQPGRRGRPPKLKPIPSTQSVRVSLGLVDEAPAVSSEKNGQGLPPKNGTQPAQSGTVLGKRGRGRPRGSKNMKLGPKGVKKGPGRQPKGQTAAAAPAPPSAVNEGSDTVNPGRIKKAVGRPRKVYVWIGGVSAPAAGIGVQLQDLNTIGYGELKRKFDFFQAKVKAAVDVIKPYISNATALSVRMAIQELEGLASMDGC